MQWFWIAGSEQVHEHNLHKDEWACEKGNPLEVFVWQE